MLDFGIIFQLRTKKFWWMDVIFYFAMSLLVATVLCYLIFLIKNNFQKKDIADQIVALQTEGTDRQKEQESEVISYQKKISDFSNLLKNHAFASQVFYFMQKETMPNVWLKNFTLDGKKADVTFSGEADSAAAFSHQIEVFEKNEYVKSINVLNSTMGESLKQEFNLDLALNPKIFNYLADMGSLLQTTTQSLGSTISTTPADNPETNGQVKSSQKLITVFDFSQPIQVIGTVNQNDHTVELNVPSGTDVTNLAPSIVISPKATVSPASLASYDFTNPVVYKVTAEDLSTQDYTVTVNILPKAATKSSWSGFGIIVIVILLIVVVAGAVLGAFLMYKKRQKSKPS
jgi:hypothetical protein